MHRTGVARCPGLLLNLARSRRLKPAAQIRSAFSLIEVMIAIVILGFGLVMVATMYPIAWNRARVMTEESMAGSIADTAEQLMRSVLHVDGLKKVPPLNLDASGLAGDMVLFQNPALPFDPANPDNLDLLYYGDTRVHALNMENVTVGSASPGRRFYPYRDDPNKQPDAMPYLLEQVQPVRPAAEDWDLFAPPVVSPLFTHGFARAQIRFEDRLFPPLPARKDVDRFGVFTGIDEPWEEALDTRRFAFAVFHRQRGVAKAYVPGAGESISTMVGPDAPNPPAPSIPFIPIALEERYRDRTFDFYIVTLRRGQSTYRFVQQDSAIRFTPDPLSRDNVVRDFQGLGPDHDVVLPSPWRVQIYVPSGTPDMLPYDLRSVTMPGPMDATEGAPSIVHFNNKKFSTTSTFVADMFQPGTWFIDEWSGEIYQVASRRFDTSSGSDTVVLTLDREITVGDLDDLCQPGNCVEDGVLDDAEKLRSVWVFPPPIQGRNGAEPIFDGDSPVIGIEVRTLTFAPRP